MNANTTRGTRIGLAAAAIAAAALLAVGCSAGAPMADQIQPVAAQQSAAATADNSATGAPNPANADKISEITATVINNTDMQLTKVSATHTGTGVHWQQQPPGTLAPHSTTTVTDYAGGNNEIDLTYQDSTGATYTFSADDPAVGKDSVKSPTTSNSYGVNATSGTGLHETSTFTVYAGQSFGYTGSAQQYTVPTGVTTLNVQAIGGSGGDQSGGGMQGPVINGAEITGTMAVTPGEVLTIGVGGRGYQVNELAGGWGLPWNGSSFSGGSGRFVGAESGGGGGGASVITAGSQIQVVAGGAGGQGGSASWSDLGGKGGYDGSLTGQNGQNNGGVAGSQNTPAGQNALYTNAGVVAGAGGGGYAGGGSGQVTGEEGGGGAGSSYDAGLTGGTVTTASGPSQDGDVTLTAANS